jgi:hypothetical protein
VKKLESVMMVNNGVLTGEGCVELYLTSETPPTGRITPLIELKLRLVNELEREEGWNY